MSCHQRNHECSSARETHRISSVHSHITGVATTTVMWAGALADSVCTTLSAGPNALHGRALVHECFGLMNSSSSREGQTLLGCLLTSVSYCRSNNLYTGSEALPGANFRIARFFRLLTTGSG